MKRLLHAVFALSILLISLSPLVLAYSVPPDTIVYVTPTGNKYHREGCSHIKGSATPMTIYEAAEVRELGPCSRCNPDILTGPYVSGDTRSGSSGSSGGSTSPNYPDKYEPPAEYEMSPKQGTPFSQSIPDTQEASSTPPIVPTASDTKYSVSKTQTFLVSAALCLAIVGIFSIPSFQAKREQGKVATNKQSLFSDEPAHKKRAYTIQLFGIGCHILAGILLAFVYFSGLYFENFWIIEIILAVLGMLLIYGGALALRK